MKIFKYTLKLIDPLFYSLEGLSGATTPKFIHATAINHAVLYATEKDLKFQPYLMAEENGGRNIPRYRNSLVSQEFYLTPARLKGNVVYMPEIAKGELDGFVVKGYPGAEVLRASRLFSIAPESEFEGYGFLTDGFELPSLVRLGSFRGKARLEWEEVMFIKQMTNESVDHPVDPLVSEAIRGVMVNLFPYPLVENAICKSCLEIREKGSRFPRKIVLPVVVKSKNDDPIREACIII